jgi:glycosyltransferase involved in cell wall biosynthesis
MPTKLRPIKLAFNAVPLLSPLTGIGQYADNLLREFDLDEQTNTYKFYGSNWAFERASNQQIKAAGVLKKIIRHVVPNARALSRGVQQFRFSAGVKRFKPDLYHEPNYLAFHFDGPTVITVHDLSWIRYPEMHPIERVRAMNKYFEPALRRATRIITDSQFVKDELVDVFGVNATHITPVYLGAEEMFRPMYSSETQQILQNHGLQHGAYWLGVGTLEPRKNLQLALSAFMRLPKVDRQACPMVLVGMKGWRTDALEAQLAPLVLSGEVRVLGYLSRAELVTLMAGAKALIYPSVYEGFGLPLLEAMCCGVPVITSNVSSLPEVVGDTGILIDPLDIDGLREQMLKLRHDENLCKRMGAAALGRSKQFSWAQCAQNTMQVYQAALA